IEYQEKFLLPYTAALYDFQNNEMMKAGKDDRAIELSLATRIKSNANVMKNYRGKMKGLKAIELLKSKQEEDLALAQFIENDASLKGKYGSLMADIDNLYKDIFSDAERDLWFNQIYSSTRLLNVARQLNAFKLAVESSDNKEETFQRNLPRLTDILNSLYESYNFSADSAIFTKMLLDASKFSNNQPVTAVGKRSDLIAFANASLSESKLKDKDFVFTKLLRSPKSLSDYSDNLLLFQKDLETQQLALKPEMDRREGVLNQLMGDYVAVKEQFQKRDFIPDANSTLRLTYGYIRGYSPADATYVKPFTTIRGIIEKGQLGLPDFRYPSKIREVWEAKDFGPYAMKELGDVPVNLLYNMDTTGGNSGSPIMNSKGELIGVNFDRAYDATINDFAWNES